MAEVEGWTPSDSPTYPNLWYPPREGGRGRMNDELSILPSYLTDANACLRVLEKHTQMTYERDGGEPEVFRIYSPAGSHDKWWGVQMVWMHHDGDIEHKTIAAPTFCLAACEAVLRAHGKWRDKP
jgi:hypothetical protein